MKFFSFLPPSPIAKMSPLWEIFSPLAIITCTFYVFVRFQRRYLPRTVAFRHQPEPETLLRFQRLQDNILALQQDMVQMRSIVGGLDRYVRPRLGQRSTQTGKTGRNPELI